MEEPVVDSCYAGRIMSQNFIANSSPGFCEILASRQSAMSALLLDIAWLLKAPHLEEKEAFWSFTNVQRLTSMLKFLLQNELFSVLQAIMHHLDNIILTEGFDKPDNWTSDVDQKLYDDFLNHVREILFQRTLNDTRLTEPKNPLCGLLMPQTSQKTSMCAKNYTNQVSYVVCFCVILVDCLVPMFFASMFSQPYA